MYCDPAPGSIAALACSAAPGFELPSTRSDGYGFQSSSASGHPCTAPSSAIQARCTGLALHLSSQGLATAIRNEYVISPQFTHGRQMYCDSGPGSIAALACSAAPGFELPSTRSDGYGFQSSSASGHPCTAPSSAIQARCTGLALHLSIQGLATAIRNEYVIRPQFTHGRQMYCDPAPGSIAALACSAAPGFELPSTRSDGYGFQSSSASGHPCTAPSSAIQARCTGLHCTCRARASPLLQEMDVLLAHSLINAGGHINSPTGARDSA